MQIKTRGIVINSLKYSDSSVIVSIYTQQFGRVSYMVYGTGKKKSAFRSSFLQALTLVDMDVLHTPGKEIQRIKDIRITYPLTGIPFHPVRSSLAFFISEVLMRALQQSEPDDMLYEYIENSVQILDCCEVGLANFHLVFMIRLAKYLGFEPNSISETGKYFDMLNGVFCNSRPPHVHVMDEQEANAFLLLTKAGFDHMGEVMLSREIRYRLISDIEQYYRLHLPDFRSLNSLSVLHELFD